MKIIMMRHGQSEDNLAKVYSRDDSNLTDLGKAQITSACKNLTGKEFSRIYCSPLERTRESWDIVKSYFHKPCSLEHNIREVNFGSFQGYSYEEVLKLFNLETQNWIKDPFLNGPLNGESINTAYKRVAGFIEKLKENNEDVLLITHDGVIRLILCHILESPESFFKFKISNGSLSTVTIEKDYAQIESVNV